MQKNSAFLRNVIFILILFLVVFIGWSGYKYISNFYKELGTGAPPYGEALESVPELGPKGRFSNWRRPEGPPKVGLQIGHLNSSQFPDELSQLRDNTGTSGGGKWEWEVNKDIAEKIAQNLSEYGVQVDILPATVTPDYWADAFIAIHADGSLDSSISGYKVAPPWRDWSGKANKLSELIEKSYGSATGLPLDPNISRNMRGYYAFAWWRYEHSIHEMTPGVIVETGFLTNKSDQKLLINNSSIAAEGVSKGIIEFLAEEGLLK